MQNHAGFIEWLGAQNYRTSFTEAVSSAYHAILESASSVLYHFTNYDGLMGIVSTNSFKLSPNEKEMSGGKNFMSFSRTGSFREGYPVVLHCGMGEVLGDDWCMIRITVDGDALNRLSRIRDDSGLHNYSVKPFDFAHESYGNDFGDEVGVKSRIDNGKEWMMASDDGYQHTVPVGSTPNVKICGRYLTHDRENHPYSQAEDRLVSTATRLPNADKIIKRIDVVLVRDNYDMDNLETRHEFLTAIVDEKLFDKFKLYFYTSPTALDAHRPSDIPIFELLLTDEEAEMLDDEPYDIEDDTEFDELPG